MFFSSRIYSTEIRTEDSSIWINSQNEVKEEQRKEPKDEELKNSDFIAKIQLGSPAYYALEEVQIDLKKQVLILLM
jgi:hypothetical protein